MPSVKQADCWLLLIIYGAENDQSMIVGVYADKESAIQMFHRESKRTGKKYVIVKANRDQVAQLVKHGALRDGDPPEIVIA